MVDGRPGNFLCCKSGIDCFLEKLSLNLGGKNGFLQYINWPSSTKWILNFSIPRSLTMGSV